MIYSGQEEASLEPLDLSELVEEMSELLRATISRKSLLHFDLDKRLPPIFGNAVQIRQLVMNLVINASHAIGEQDGTIYIKTPSPRARHMQRQSVLRIPFDWISPILVAA